MNLSNIKLIAADLDGTLLNSKKKISSKFKNQLKILNKLNILFVVASGRPYYNSLEKLNPVKDEVIYISENGGIIVDNDKVITASSLSLQELQILDPLLIQINNVTVIYCTKEMAYIRKTEKRFIPTVTEYYSKYTQIDSIAEINTTVVKIAIYHPISSERYIYPVLENLNDSLKVIVSASNWVDISKQDINKGMALQIIASNYGIKDSEILAFGDYLNDIEMLKMAGYSVSMANAHPDIKVVTTHHTSSNNNFGVEKVIDRLIKQQINSQMQ